MLDLSDLLLKKIIDEKIYDLFRHVTTPPIPYVDKQKKIPPDLQAGLWRESIKQIPNNLGCRYKYFVNYMNNSICSQNIQEGSI